MRIDVADILAQGEGYRKSFAIVDEAIELDDLIVSDGLNGEVTIIRTEAGLSLEGQVQLSLKLECHRCLREYVFPEDLQINGHFSRESGGEVIEDIWPIAKDSSIDIAPLVHQEAVLQIPLQQLHSPDCAGLDPATGLPKIDDLYVNE